MVGICVTFAACLPLQHLGHCLLLMLECESKVLAVLEARGQRLGATQRKWRALACEKVAEG